MKKSILKIIGSKELSSNEQKTITGGRFEFNQDLCCWKEDSPINPPFGCMYWVLCDSF